MAKKQFLCLKIEIKLTITPIFIFELIAVITGLIYPFLAGKNKISCWLFALISAVIYIFINISVHYYFLAIQQFMYAVMAIYGWITWRRPKMETNYHFYGLKNIPVISLGVALSVGLVYLTGFQANQQMAYFDAFSLVFGLLGSYMIAQKVMESWLYLTVVNIVGIYMYFEISMYLTLILYVSLTFLAINAFKDWVYQYKLLKSDK
ncbi:MAG TPA: nicotinamide riboside transporter PnuC [Crocinitomicaceae bacterium]|nr:nicotinamide riboside transporter PnuC [Crocinitomicaceae bacterium]